ncbi:MAG TPA: hypothetical protein VIJ42_13985 [Stellaceae bacterium]
MDRLQIPPNRVAQIWANERRGAIHENLPPQPFYGNLHTARCYLLFGNPAARERDYEEADAQRFAEYWHQQLQMLHGAQVGFLPLSPIGEQLSAGFYWRRVFRRLLACIFAVRANAVLENHYQDLLPHMCVIEANAYSSRRRPHEENDAFPSSVATRQFVQTELRDRAENGNARILVWRRQDFWNLAPGHNVMVRDPQRAQLPFLREVERDFLRAELMPLLR